MTASPLKSIFYQIQHCMYRYIDVFKRFKLLTGKRGGGWEIGPGKASPLPNPRASTLKETFFPLPLPRPAIYKRLRH